MITVTTEDPAKYQRQYLDKAQHGDRVLVKEGSRALAVLSPVGGADVALDEDAILEQLAKEGGKRSPALLPVSSYPRLARR